VTVTVGGAGVSVAPGVSVGGSVDVMITGMGVAGAELETSRPHAVSININATAIKITRILNTSEL
jgi:hypothetical protein